MSGKTEICTNTFSMLLFLQESQRLQQLWCTSWKHQPLSELKNHISVKLGSSREHRMPTINAYLVAHRGRLLKSWDTPPNMLLVLCMFSLQRNRWECKNTCSEAFSWEEWQLCHVSSWHKNPNHIWHKKHMLIQIALSLELSHCQKWRWRWELPNFLKIYWYAFPTLFHASSDPSDFLACSFQQFHWWSQDCKLRENQERWLHPSFSTTAR